MNITFCHVYAISDPGNSRYTGVLPLFKGRALTITMTVVMAIVMSIGVVASESTIGPVTIEVVAITLAEVASMSM